MSKIFDFFKKIFVGPDEEVVPCSASPPADEPQPKIEEEKGAAPPSDTVVIKGITYRRPGAD